MKKIITAYWVDESAATSIEYGVVVAVLALGIVVAAGALGLAINNKFATAASETSKVI